MDDEYHETKQRIADRQSFLQDGDFDMEEPIYVELPQDGDAVAPKNKIICTILLIIINVIVYWRCLGIDRYSATGGANYRDIIEGGEYGRLLSYMFLHSDLSHLYFNMIALFLFGKSVEEELGSFRMFLIYFTAGIGSGLCSVLLHHTISPDEWTNSIGASGAIYALVVSALLLAGKRISGSWIRSILIVAVYIVADISMTKTEGVDIFAHLGGAVIGFLITLLIVCFRRENKPEYFVMKVLGIALTVFFSLIAVQEANLGKVSAWSAERIQFIQEAHLNSIPDISFGEALEEFCSETAWKAFSTRKKKEIVEFNGRGRYQGGQREISVQFTVNMDDASYQITYLSLDEESQTNEEIVDFLREVFSVYGEKHGIAINR